MDVSEQTKRLLDNDTNLKQIKLRIDMFFGEGSEGKASAEALALVEEFTRAMETCSLTNLQLNITCRPNRSHEAFGFIKRMVQCNCIHDLELCYFTINHFSSIVEALSRNSAIQNLEIAYCPFGKEGVTAIAKMLHSETISLKSLFLFCNTGMGDEGCRAVVEVLCACPALKVLEMSDCHMGIEGANAIGKFLQSSECAIEEIRIPENPISDEGCVAVMEGLMENSSIKVLEMRSCEIGKEGVEAIANVLSSGKCAIEELSVEQNNDIKDEGCVMIMEALRNNNSICKLDLSDCDIGDEGMKSIANVLQNNHGACLRNLSLQWNRRIGLEGFKALANVLSSFKNLDLLGCHLYDQDCINLMDALSHNSSIKVIDLGYCQFGNEGGKAVANFLKSNISSIQELNLEGNDLDEESLSKIANALHFNTHLTKLSLGEVGQEEVWIKFRDATDCNHSLQELDMRGNEDEDGFWDYMEAIEKNLDNNKKLGPVKAEMHKTGKFRCQILPFLTKASFFVEALSKVASLEHLSPLFDLVCERPLFFDLDHCVAERPTKICRME